MNKESKNSKFKLPKSLLFFVGLSFLFWGLINLSKTYKTKQVFEVDYISLPQDKLLQKEPQKTITLEIEGSGFKLLTSKLVNKKIDVFADALKKKSKYNYYTLLSNQTSKIQNQLYKGITILNFEKDTVSFNLGYLASKKIPVIPDYDLNFKAGYNIADSIYVDKDSIVISGPEKAIDTISTIYTTYKSFKNISENIKESLSINTPKKSSNIRLSDSIINIRINVEKFTEGELEIPFIINNLPKDIIIKTFPKTVKIKFKVGLSKFNSVSANDYLVVCDYNYALENNLSYLIPKIEKAPSSVSSSQISPKKIDFLIQK